MTRSRGRKVLALTAAALVAGTALVGVTGLRGVHQDRVEGFPPGQQANLSVSVGAR